ncbi:hypothetical protein E3N88_42337 [Mikania micrantha]|uniref:TFIIS N-terminal domain-containing protein n=1 Tax=Mikania micrantha TaxID=192012 RepID=A0A5N6LI72_9ASTR|nr:hypothetical protein E3N88_42337 [Mikania micrantha]
MAISNANQQLDLVVSSNSNTSCEELLESQKVLISKQIYELQNIVSKQCKLTGVNPLSQEMVRDFFNGQRSRVRKFIRLSREKAIQSTESMQKQDMSLGSNVDLPNHPVPLNSVGPSSIEAPSCSMQNELLPDTDDSEKYFTTNIFNLLREEETFSGQMKLMEWILQIQNASVLYWFMTNGGVMILASWLSQAAIEEQTTVLHVILRVLCHLPLHRALPAHMSAILQSVNKLRFYRGSDISNRAKSLLSRWSKMFARSQAMRRPNANISFVDAQNEMLLKQRQAYLCLCCCLNFFSSSQSIKLLTGPSDDSNMKLLRGVSSSYTRERRKVQLVEQPGQKTANRGPQVTRIFSTSQGRPLSTDDIQKAKMRAQFMRSKYGESPKVAKAHAHSKVESMMSLAIKQPKAEELKSLRSDDGLQAVPVHGKGIMDSEEPKCKRFQISWAIPPEMKMNKEWSVCCGENSKEIDVQNNRIRREKEVFYNTVVEIPQNPKEPWDREMDYDDSLTPEIPTDQLPDDDDHMVVESNHDAAAASTSRNTPGPDLELLAVLLKNPQIVFALTAGQGGSLTDEQMVKLLDAIKANATSGGSIDSLVNGLVYTKAEEPKVEVSLPSPTPSSNPVTSGWRQESGKHHFSRQSVAGVYFQETITNQRIIPAAAAAADLTNLPDHRNIQNAYNLLPEHQIHLQPESWMGQEANPYPHGTNYNVFGTRYGDGPGFESWSPNNSPLRSHDGSYNNYYRSRDTSRYHDRGGSSWWRERRR